MVRSTKPQMRNCASGNLEIPGLLAPRNDVVSYTATNNATPITISAMPDSSRPDSDCLNE
jgi:hypothetical protein